jgi:hypothetical protein
MTTSNFWGFQQQTPNEEFSAPYDVSTVIRESLREGSTAANFPPQSASADAQSSAGLGIQNVKRAFVNLAVPYDPAVGGLLTTTSTVYELIDDSLGGSITTSGRPLMVFLRGTAQVPSSGYVTLSVTIDGDEVTGGDGMSFVSPAFPKPFLGMFTLTPDPGTHIIRAVWKSATGSLVQMAKSSRPSLIAVEI